MSTIALVRHRVGDFDAWRKVYDGFAPIQAEHGVRAHQVLRSIEDPNDVTVEHTSDSAEAAKTFFAMPELKTAMSEAGVKTDSIEISYFRRGRGRGAGWRVAKDESRAASLHGRGSAHPTERVRPSKRPPSAVDVSRHPGHERGFQRRTQERETDQRATTELPVRVPAIPITRSWFDGRLSGRAEEVRAVTLVWLRLVGAESNPSSDARWVQLDSPTKTIRSCSHMSCAKIPSS